MPIDSFRAMSDSPLAASRAPFAIVPHDSNEIAVTPKALYVGTAGNLVLRGIDAIADVTLKNVPAGAILDVRAQYVRATGTTAADIVGLA
jgi:hypothetical protein